VRLVVLGLSITSSWGNGHATTYRALLKGVAARGHDVHVVAPWHPAIRRQPVEDGVHFHFFHYSPTRSLNVFGYAEGLHADTHLRLGAWAVAPAAMGSMTPAPRPAAPAPVMPVVAKPMPAATPRAPSASAEATPAVARPAAMPRATAAPAMQPSVAPAAPPRAPAVAAAATAPQPPSAKPATLPGLATVATKPTPSQRLRAAIAAKSQSTSAIAPTPKPQPAPPTAGSPVAAKPSVAPVAPAPVAPVAPRSDPPKAGLMSAPATRYAAPPSLTEQRLSRPAASSSPASRDDSIPMLTLDLEQDEDPFDLDFDMSAAQIDEALRTEMSEVPVLMDSVEVSGADAAVDLSMRLALDEETQRKLVNLEALSHAKALEDISNSMAETLFGDAELDQLAATLALATGSLTDDDDEALGLPAKHRAGTSWHASIRAEPHSTSGMPVSQACRPKKKVA